jgi:hypothetical protein
MTDHLSNRTLVALRRRLDRAALAQLRAEAARLAEENEQLRERLAYAEDNAEFWSREATGMHLQLCELRGGQPGITQAGQLVVAHA